MRDPDVVVIGAGPNGLVAAAHLARAGLRVLALEAKDAIGGACASRALTLPGFVHDVGAGFFPFASGSPALAPLSLAEHGLSLCHAPIDSAHPALDGSCAALARDHARALSLAGDDAREWRPIFEWLGARADAVLPALLGPIDDVRAKLALDATSLTMLAEAGLSSTRGYSARFRAEASRRVLPALGLHADVAPDDRCGAAVGLMLAALAATAGFPVARGGAQAVPTALAGALTSSAGEVRTGARVSRIVVRRGRAVAVALASGEEISARVAVVADTGAPALYLRLLPPEVVPSGLLRRMRRYPYGWGTFKIDWALSGQVPFTSAPCREAAVVHAGESVDDLARFAREVRAGLLPNNPYLVLGQASVADPSRAPAGCHTLYAYTHAPSELDGGWPAARERFADAIERRVEGLAPGFRALILARAIHDPGDLERFDENLVGGDLGGGTADITNQLVLRPAFPWFRHATPVAGLYLCSAYTHPGTGVHGACGWNAARAVLRREVS
ncbi:MAG: NAD(P)/FAD-dependent oxidoreductase [Polyangiaceae bacterium]|nr:NAD(P)/FAD-dependent oxidoreductase [Polyangiaceae bacterium]